MKPITLIALFFLLSTGVKISAQKVTIQTNGKEVELQEDTTAKLRSFSGKYNSEKVYLHWLIMNLHENGIFFIYRSNDKINYEIIGKKEGIGVPISQEVAYYFTDETPVEGIAYYKLLLISKNYSYKISYIITILSPCFIVSKSN